MRRHEVITVRERRPALTTPLKVARLSGKWREFATTVPHQIEKKRVLFVERGFAKKSWDGEKMGSTSGKPVLKIGEGQARCSPRNDGFGRRIHNAE
jgi:hypothetical protein